MVNALLHCVVYFLLCSETADSKPEKDTERSSASDLWHQGKFIQQILNEDLLHKRHGENMVLPLEGRVSANMVCAPPENHSRNFLLLLQT